MTTGLGGAVLRVVLSCWVLWESCLMACSMDSGVETLLILMVFYLPFDSPV